MPFIVTTPTELRLALYVDISGLAVPVKPVEGRGFALFNAEISAKVTTPPAPQPIRLSRSSTFTTGIEGRVVISAPVPVDSALFTVGIDGTVFTETLGILKELSAQFNVGIDGRVSVQRSVEPTGAMFNVGIGANIAVTPGIEEYIWGSKIGQLDFGVDESNEAFRRPILAKGNLYRLCRIENSILVIAEHGVDVMSPVEINWRYQHISDIGALSPWAVVDVGDKEVYMIDENHCLVHYDSNGMQMLDYRTYLKDENYTLMWDYKYDMLYISSPTSGWVYNPASQSFGSGYAGLTGSISTGQVAGTGTLEAGNFNVCTNMYDFGTRSMKTILELQFSMRTDTWLEAAVDYRVGNQDVWKTTPWKRVTQSGRAHVPCYGVEFRFRVRSRQPEPVHLDQILVVGTVHGYDFLNAVGWAPGGSA